jgi:uncharacterized membrane protein YeaQ/YmgE (transglycosylase-associated protein family)
MSGLSSLFHLQQSINKLVGSGVRRNRSKLLQPVLLKLTARDDWRRRSACRGGPLAETKEDKGSWTTMSILWTIVIGFVAGVLAKLIHPGPNEPSGFILTTLLGIAGAFVATYLGQAIGWYRADEAAGLIGATVGALIVLFVWGMFARRTPA